MPDENAKSQRGFTDVEKEREDQLAQDTRIRSGLTPGGQPRGQEHSGKPTRQR